MNLSEKEFQPQYTTPEQRMEHGKHLVTIESELFDTTTFTAYLREQVENVKCRFCNEKVCLLGLLNSGVPTTCIEGLMGRHDRVEKMYSPEYQREIHSIDGNYCISSTNRRQ